MAIGESCISGQAFEVSRLVTGPLDNNVYFVRCTATNSTVMVDAPGGEPSLLVELCRANEIEVALVTHGHFDHVGAIDELRSSGVRVGVGAGDITMAPDVDFSIGNGDVFAVGELELIAINTPGHTPGSTCFSLRDAGVILTGDTLFNGGPGATRWHYSNPETIIESITQKLFAYEDSATVLPGHGPGTTIGDERVNLQRWIARR